MGFIVNPYRFAGGGGGDSGASLVFLAGFNGTDGAQALLDESAYERPVVAYDNVQIDTAESKFGGSSLLFDGSSDTASLPWSPSLQFGTSDFTIDFWVKRAASGGSSVQHLFGTRYPSTSNGDTGIAFSIVSGKVECIYMLSDGTRYTLTSTSSLSSASFMHVAFDRDATGKVRLYIDGVMEASDTPANRTVRDRPYPLTMGSTSPLGGSNYFAGWLDEVRILIGSAAYASDSGFTPATSEYTRPTPPGPTSDTDANFSTVKLLLGFDGTTGATTFTDDSSAAQTVSIGSGTPALSDIQSLQGGTSLKLASGDRLDIADSSDWAFGSGAFTMEAWVLPTTTSGNRFLMGQRSSASNDLSLLITSGGLLEFRCNLSSGFVQISSTGYVVVPGCWTHIAVDRDGTGTFRIYINGTMRASASSALALVDSSVPFTIGKMNASTSALPYTGFMDEIRVTKGVARYATDGTFAIPEQSFPRS